MSLPEAKVEHHEGRGVRSWPLFPVLRTILEQLLEELTIDGRYPSPESFVVNKPEYRAAAMRPGGWANANLRTQFLKILRKAGVAPWARLFHSTRASRQTELEAQFPLHVVCSWLGNSESVARDSYLLVTDSHFQAATTPIRGTPALRLDETPDEKTGNSCATGVQQIAARNGTQENETNENTGENEKSQVSLAFFKWRRGELNTHQNTRDLAQKTTGNALSNARTNEQRLVEIWQRSGEELDELHLKIFRLMSERQQAELLEQLQ